MLNAQQIIAEADRCVACGLCLPYCPTYIKTGSEADSPRGRIQLISAVAREILPANDRFKQHIDLCLGCRNCETACPNGVHYGALIDSARANIAKPATLSNKLANYFVSHSTHMRLAGNVIRIAQTLGLINLASRILPTLKKPIALLPNMPKQQIWRELYKTNHPQTSTLIKQNEVSLFLGCISNTFDTNTLRASVFVLNQLGFNVRIPTLQTCCGGLARQQGDDAEATRLIMQNDNAFNQDNAVITIASGCGAGLQDYSNLKIVDISAFLMQCDWSNISLQPLNKNIADEILVHEPCTLRNVQKTHLAVVDLLKKIPQATITNLPANAQCCGGAGAYMLNQPTMAAQLLDDKILAIKNSKAKILATSNIGCAMHIAAGLRAQHIQVSVLHPVNIIAKQMGFNDKLD